jgi:hypothetical protein
MLSPVLLGGNDITEHCQSIVHEPELNLRSYAEVRVPSELVTFTEGGDFLELAGSQHKGRAYMGEDSGEADDQFRTIQSYSGLVWWDRMQVMDADGDYSDPSIIADNLDAVSIMAAALNNWNSFEGGSDLSVGTAAGGGSPLIGFKPTDWPWSLDRLREFLVNTGQLDVVENHGSDTVDLYNGDYGTDLSGSVAFQYATGAFNCVAARYAFDFTKTISRLRYFLGPKRPQFEGDVQHWARDVQIDDPALDVAPFDARQPTIEGLSAAIEGLISRLRRIEVFDSNGDENALKDLYMHIWQTDALVSFRPRRLLSVTPEPGIAPAFTCGDLISVAAELGESHSGVERVYSYRAEQDTEGNVQLTRVTTSGDQET